MRINIKLLLFFFITAFHSTFSSLCIGHILHNPVAPDGADPRVIQKNGVYYYCYSKNNSIWVNSAPKIQDAVQMKGKVIWTPADGQPYSKEIWAPELHFLNGRWYVYFAADDGKNENHRMYVLESETGDALGNYKFRGKIAAPSDKWAIDGTVLVINKHIYFIWSGWEGDDNVSQNIYITPMKDPLTINAERTLISKPEYDWETVGNPLVNEGPEVLKHDGKIFIIYSASGSWTDSYCLGQLTLTGKNPLDPKAWKKNKTPVFTGTDSIFSPGHASFTKSPDETEDWIVYHTAKYKGAMWKRNVCMQKFIWDVDGNPVFGKPVSCDVEIDEPSDRR